MGDRLIDSYDAALFDLDGVVYLGPEPVEGAADGIAALRETGVRVGFVTNNAARTPAHVAEHLNELGVHAEVEDVVTSSQAGARLVAEKVSPSAKVLVVGTDALRAEVEAMGLTPVNDARAEPAAVIQGYHPQLPWPLVDEAAFAIQAGALWVATNTDATRPTDRGLVAGAGAQVGALRKAVTVDPLVAGKPFAPLLEESARRLDASKAIFVGDRLDTDIDGAAAVGMESLFVFTGAHGKADLVAADHLPTHLGHDLRALLQPARTPAVDGVSATCGEARVTVTDGSIQIESTADSREGHLDALRCALALLASDRTLNTASALDRLTEVT